jgi:hypothetical protein
MGMFSWCCKGCGHELITNEYVRMNGCKGTYDGYGGCSGGFDYEDCDGEPSCWHEVCYQKATPEQKLDESPSDHAPDQGFGYAALAFLKGFDERVETCFKPIVHVSHYDKESGESKRWKFYVVKTDEDFVLQEYNHYHSVYNDYEDNYWANVPDSWWQDTPQAEKERVYDERKRFIQDAIGMKNPEENAFIFDSFDEAKRASENLLSTLPNPEYGFSLCIFGIQGKIEGLYFQRDCLPKFKKVKNGEGQFDYDIMPTGEHRDMVMYHHNAPSEPKKHWSELIENY